MKKSLIAVAVAAALPAAAIAQTNVQLYGIGDVNLTFANKHASNDGKSQIQMNDGLQSGSRIGVQGSEDLGGGLSATFRFEAGLDVDDGDTEGKFFGRQARVGLKGNFGEIRAGRQYSPIFYSAVDQDFTGYGWYNNHFGIAGSQGRWDNELEYRNKFGGFEIIAAIAPMEGTDQAVAGGAIDPDADEVAYGLAGMFNLGGFGVGIGYQDEGAVNFVHAGVNGKFGPFQAGVNFGMGTPDEDGGLDLDRQDIDLSFGLKTGASGHIILNVLLIDFGDDAGSEDRTNIGLSYRHDISKRTNWYAALGMDRIDNQDDPMRVSVGVRHRF